MARIVTAIAIITLGAGQSAFAAPILPSSRIDWDADFDGIYTGAFRAFDDGNPEGPWTHDRTSGTWLANGSANLGSPSRSLLSSPTVEMTRSGSLYLHFTHRYSFEVGDGGAVFLDVNGSGFHQILADSFAANPYDTLALTGNHDLLGLQGFNGDSMGYGGGEYVTSVARLGVINQGDFITVRFLAAWDDYAKGRTPNWQITYFALASVPEPGTLGTLSMAALVIAGIAIWRKRPRLGESV